MQKTIQRCYAFSTKIVVAAMLALTAATVHAQFTGSYQTITIDGVISNYPGYDYYVGSQGAAYPRWNDTLIIINGGGLFVTNGATRIGDSTASSNNAVEVTGVGSFLTNSTALYVGSVGMNNTLTIANGGTAYSKTYGTVGYSGANNMALVTGTGSVWNALTFTVGSYGVGNQATISNGGAVVNTGESAIGGTASASNNAVLVTGPGSVWRSTGNITIGTGAGNSGNQLTIANGGAVYSAGHTMIGAAGTRSNTGLVTGAGSVLSNTIVYFYGAFGQLTISNGGTVYAGTTRIGDNTSASNNAVLVTGAGSVLTNSSILYVGVLGTGGNQLTIADGGAVYNYAVADAGIIGYGGNSNTVVISGRGSVWRTTGGLLVNNAGTGSGLIMSNGGVASVSGNVTIKTTGYITNYVTGIAGGLDMAAGKTLTPTNMAVIFVAEPTETGPFWGLRWQGTNAVATLRGYTNSGALRIDFTALPEYWRKKASDPIFYDGANTYIGFNVTHIPVKGTIVSVW
ncbi:MAG: hypothetical protein WC381_06960 [Kiritimatiellia bacterium]